MLLAHPPPPFFLGSYSLSVYASGSDFTLMDAREMTWTEAVDKEDEEDLADDIGGSIADLVDLKEKVSRRERRVYANALIVLVLVQHPSTSAMRH